MHESYSQKINENTIDSRYQQQQMLLGRDKGKRGQTAQQQRKESLISVFYPSTSQEPRARPSRPASQH